MFDAVGFEGVLDFPFGKKLRFKPFDHQRSTPTLVSGV
jgi:hypothetical protein